MKSLYPIPVSSSKAPGGTKQIMPLLQDQKRKKKERKRGRSRALQKKKNQKPRHARAPVPAGTNRLEDKPLIYVFGYKTRLAGLQIKFSKHNIEEIEILNPRRNAGKPRELLNGAPCIPVRAREIKQFPHLLDLIRLFDGYFSGKNAAPKAGGFKDIPVNFSIYSDFSKKILSELRSVEYGKTISYGELALRAGFAKKYARACARALSKNRTPILIPCHRVIMSGGETGGFTGGEGVAFKEKLLTLEGSG